MREVDDVIEGIITSWDGSTTGEGKMHASSKEGLAKNAQMKTQRKVGYFL